MEKQEPKAALLWHPYPRDTGWAMSQENVESSERVWDRFMAGDTPDVPTLPRSGLRQTRRRRHAFRGTAGTTAHNLTLLDQARAVAEAWAHRAGQKEGRRRAPFLGESDA